MQKLKKDDLLKFKNEYENYCINYNTDEFMDLLDKYDLLEYTEDIYTEDYMTNDMKKNLEEYGSLTVRNMILNIKDVTEKYFFKDAYGNYSNVTNSDINCIIDNIIDNYSFEQEEDYEL